MLVCYRFPLEYLTTPPSICRLYRLLFTRTSGRYLSKAEGSCNTLCDFQLTRSSHSPHIRLVGSLPGFVCRHAQGLPMWFRETSMERHRRAIAMLHESKSGQARTYIPSPPFHLLLAQRKGISRCPAARDELPSAHSSCLECPIINDIPHQHRNSSSSARLTSGLQH